MIEAHQLSLDELIQLLKIDKEDGGSLAAHAIEAIERLSKALRLARSRIEYLGAACNDPRHFEANQKTFLPAINEVLGVDIGSSLEPKP